MSYFNQTFRTNSFDCYLQPSPDRSCFKTRMGNMECAWLCRHSKKFKKYHYNFSKKFI